MAVNTVFGRSGDVVALAADYQTFYAPNGAHLPAGGTSGQVLAKLSGANFDVGWTTSGVGSGLASDTVKGAVLLSVAASDPLNPIALGSNDISVERTTSKVTAFSSPTNTQYPSALLVSTALALKVDKQVALTPATKTKVTYNADGLITGGADATTADIADSSGKRYVTDAHLTNLGNLSGVNTGDQNLSGYATTSALATTNANVTAISTSLSSYATTASLATTNANVTANTTSISNCATNAALATTNSNVSALSTNLSTNYTPLTTHNALQTQVDTLSNTFTTAPVLVGPTTIDLTDTGTGVAPTTLYLDHIISGGAGSPVAGFGIALEFRGSSNTTTNRTQGKIRTEWTSASDPTRSANFVFSKVLNGTLSDAMWLRSDGSLAVGNNLGGGFGTIWAQNGFQTSGMSIAGQVLRYDGVTGFVTAQLNTSDVVGQLESCIGVKTATTDQTATAETVHLSANISAGSIAGTTFKVVAWGNIDNGTTAVLFTPRLRWGTSGTILLAGPTIQGTTTALTNKSWKLEFLVTITSAGASGTARVSGIKWDHTTLTTGLISVECTDSGATDVASINTTTSIVLNLTWQMDVSTGTPHVRTLGGTMEIVNR